LGSELPWIPIRKFESSTEQQKYKLRIGDKVRFGRQVMKVLEIVINKRIDSVLLPSAYVSSTLTFSKQKNF